jgi:hypothetical protein
MSAVVKRGWRPSRAQVFVGVLVLLSVWTAAASEWMGKDCEFVPQSYGLVLMYGAPEQYEGCMWSPGGMEYTHHYGEWVS